MVDGCDIAELQVQGIVDSEVGNVKIMKGVLFVDFGGTKKPISVDLDVKLLSSNVGRVTTT